MERINAIHARQSAEHASYTFIEAVAGGISAAAVWMFETLARFGRARAHARLRRELHGLSDHMLKDIGLERIDIDGLYR